MGVLLTDRGSEFSDPLAIERSCLEPGKRRCRVFYCDPLAPGQKGACERNHSELRRILPGEDIVYFGDTRRGPSCPRGSWTCWAW